MVQEATARYLGVGKGDEVTISLDFGSIFSNVKAPKAHLFALLAETVSNVTVDFEREMVQFQNLAIPWDMFGLGDTNGSNYNLTFRVKDTYASPDGKFSQIYGNAVLIDCHYVLNNVITELFLVLAAEQSKLSPEAYEYLLKALQHIQDEVNAKGINLCQLAYLMIGVLHDQSSYYLASYLDITQKILKRGNEIAQALTLNTNVTMSAPLEKQYASTSNLSAFLEGTLITIIIFLGILSAMLLYSLMLSDVDSKTYEYGMLRALGFRKNMLIGMIFEQSFSFSMPGIFLGVIIAWIFNVFLRQAIFMQA